MKKGRFSDVINNPDITYFVLTFIWGVFGAPQHPPDPRLTQILVSQVLKPPMQKGDYPMFIFADKRSPMAPEASVRAAKFSESLTDHSNPPESNHDHQMLSQSPTTSDGYVLL